LIGPAFFSEDPLLYLLLQRYGFHSFAPISLMALIFFLLCLRSTAPYSRLVAFMSSRKLKPSRKDPAYKADFAEFDAKYEAWLKEYKQLNPRVRESEILSRLLSDAIMKDDSDLIYLNFLGVFLGVFETKKSQSAGDDNTDLLSTSQTCASICWLR
jgi:hypothetical protein